MKAFLTLQLTSEYDKLQKFSLLKHLSLQYMKLLLLNIAGEMWN